MYIPLFATKAEKRNRADRQRTEFTI